MMPGVGDEGGGAELATTGARGFKYRSGLVRNFAWQCSLQKYVVVPPRSTR